MCCWLKMLIDVGDGSDDDNDELERIERERQEASWEFRD